MIVLRTKTKIALARAAQSAVTAGRKIVGNGPTALCRRGGLSWKLDLREGIDFSIFLLGSFEPEMVRAYRGMIFEGAVVIDIGANIGAHTLRFARYVGTTGTVVAVEPTRYAFERLREQTLLNPVLAPRIILLQAMLMGCQDASLAEQIESSWPLHTPKDAHPEHAGVPKATTGATVRTLDRVVSDLDLKSVDFLKLDVDGYEVEVLRGARKTLQLFSPAIFFEHAPYAIAEKGYNPQELTEILTGAGYAFTSLRRRDLAGGNNRLPEIKSGAGINLLALPKGP